MADKTQQIMWTALPNGYEPGRGYRVSVLISPKLTRTPTFPERLDEFPDLLDWPKTLASAQFEFRYHNAVVAPELVSKPDSAVWTAVFRPSTFVRSHAFEDRRGTVVLSAPLTTIHDFVEETYAGLVSGAGDDLPDRVEHLRNLRPLVKELPEPRLVLDALRNPDIQIDESDPHMAWALLQAYHRPLSAEVTEHYVKNTTGPEEDPREDARWRSHKLVELPREEDFASLIDFHQIVSSTNQYRGFLRQLGLVLDFILPEDRMPDTAMTDRLQVDVTWTPTPLQTSGVETLKDTRPFTITRLEPRAEFHPVKQNPGVPLVDGYLQLDERFRLMQIDVDGAGIKTKNFAATLLTMKGAATREPEPQVGAPALQTGGILLVEPRRARSLTSAIDRSGQHFDAESAGGDVELFQEDLIRGYHPEIHDDLRGEWQSLCRRDGLIDLVDTLDDVKVADEEGAVRLGVTQAADGSHPDVVKLYEGLFAWTGWSLTAPPPGRAVPGDDDASHAEPLSNTAPPGMPFQANFTARDRSLPSLRYGRTYRMRVRVSDLALNAASWSPRDVGPKSAVSPPLTFRRFEPVEPPAFTIGRSSGQPEKPGDGESMNRIAIRTMNDVPAKNTVAIPDTRRRHVVASRTSVKQAETHGMLDDPAGRIDPASYGMLTKLDAPLETVELDFDGVAHTYPVASDGFALPYLPDPLAEKVALRFLGPASVGVPSLPDIPYYPDSVAVDWPRALPFQIEIVDEPGTQPSFDTTARVLRVPLAKADIVRLRLSHVMPKDALEQMGVGDWFLRRFGSNAALVQAVRQRALAGGNWTLTPWTEIELIHAVQKPLVRPEILKHHVSRTDTATHARLTLLTPVDSHSTDKLDLFGRWDEPHDPLEADGPRNLIRRAHAYERKLDYAEAPGMTPPGQVAFTRIKHEFGDTMYRRIRYRIEASSRFREFMPPAIREPLAPGETNPQIKVVSDEIVQWIPNSAPPPAPEVLYVIPTFGWTRRKTQTGMTSWRDGGGLRVYMNRPWFVSGHNEMLAVVLPSANATRAQIDKDLKPFVTQWGTDPIWGSTNIATPAPGISSFPLAVRQGPLDPARLPEFVPGDEADLPPGPLRMDNIINPTLPDDSPHRFEVAPHMVGYDAERQLWYCDIVVEPGRSYFPFIRLALARYHPVSTPRAYISPVVTTEFLQLTPDRLATVTRGARRTLSVGLYGHAYTRGPGTAPSSVGTAAAQQPVIEVSVERLDETLGVDFGWSALPGTQVKKSPGTVRPQRGASTTMRGGAATRRGSAAAATSGSASATSGLAARAKTLLAARDYISILANPDLVALLRPPTIWEGTVTLPEGIAVGTRLRIVIREYERHRVDTDHISVPEGAPDPRLRLVYAEVLSI